MAYSQLLSWDLKQHCLRASPHFKGRTTSDRGHWECIALRQGSVSAWLPRRRRRNS